MAHDGWKIIVNVSAGKNFFEIKFFPAPLYKKLLCANAHCDFIADERLTRFLGDRFEVFNCFATGSTDEKLLIMTQHTLVTMQ